jgi:hypothetical protein
MWGVLQWTGAIPVNLQAFPRDFLLKLRPDLEEAESAAIVSSMVGRAPTTKEILTVSPRSTDEPGVVEIVIRIRLGSDAAPVDTHCPTTCPPRPNC